MRSQFYSISGKLLVALILAFCVSRGSEADSFNLTSYYPAPSAAYTKIQLKPLASLTASPCPEGTLYANAGDGSLLYYCDGTSYNPLPGVWTLTGDNLYLTDPSTPADKRVGIGTITPDFQLTLESDGGILATGTFGAGTILTTSGGGYFLLWYPRKAAFRAGAASWDSWDDANIGDYSVALGKYNKAKGIYSTIRGGRENFADGTSPTVAGGYMNTAGVVNSQVLGGQDNIANGGRSRVSGFGNQALNNGNVVGGGQDNIADGVQGATISGGYANRATGHDSTVSGGSGNTAAGLCTNCTIAGGSGNISNGTDTMQTISGGERNLIPADIQYATISGGHENTANGFASTASGGDDNTAGADYSTVVGGKLNTASGDSSVVVGGHLNSATAYATAVGGGYGNTASGDFSVIIGGEANGTSAQYSFVGGKNMKLSATANHTFLWGHAAAPITPVTTADAFIIYSGKVGIRDTDPGAILEINAGGGATDYLHLKNTGSACQMGHDGTIMVVKNNGFVGVGVANPAYPLQFWNGAYLTAGGVFTNASSRDYKENISPLSPEQTIHALKELHPVTFNYKNDKDEEHAGFIAEDVPDLVALEGRKGLSPLDIAAVLIKAVQEQHAVLKRQKAERESLLREIAELKKQSDKTQ